MKKKNNKLLKLLEKRRFDKNEFLEILDKSASWALIDIQKKEKIETSLKNRAVKKILKITVSTQLFDGTVNFVAGSFGFSQLIAGNIDLITSPAGMAYFGKLMLAPAIAYLYWGRDKVKNKHRNAFLLAVPVIGGFAFPAMTLKNHRDFFRFLKIYNRTKHHYRELDKKNEELFRKILTEEFNHKPSLVSRILKKNKSRNMELKTVEIEIKD